jgi:hypothetical protein
MDPNFREELGLVTKVEHVPDRWPYSVTVECGAGWGFYYLEGYQVPHIGDHIHLLNRPGGNIRGVAVNDHIIYFRKWPFYFEQPKDDPAYGMPVAD